MKTKIFGILFLSLFCLSMVSAWGPQTHYYIVTQALEQSPDTLIEDIIEDNWNACLAGIQYPDVGIFEYYTNFKDYQALHNYNTVDRMLSLAKTDEDRAFAYCFKMHLAADAVSHANYVPGRIRATKLPNYLLHPIAELKIEGYYLDEVGFRLMEDHRRFDWLVEEASGRDWSGEADKLNTILGGGNFYAEGFVPTSVTLFAKAQNVFYKLLKIVVPEKTGKEYIDYSIKECVAVLRGETGDIDPSGEQALRAADSETQIWLYVISFIIIAILFVVSFKYKIIGFPKLK